jgi:hypothetical protein
MFCPRISSFFNPVANKHTVRYTVGNNTVRVGQARVEERSRLYIPTEHSGIQSPAMTLLWPTVLWTTREGRKSSTTSGCTRIYLIRLRMSPAGLSVSWSSLILIPDDLDNFRGLLNQPPQKPRSRYTRTFCIVVAFRFLLFCSGSYVPDKNWWKQGCKSGEEWIYGCGGVGGAGARRVWDCRSPSWLLNDMFPAWFEVVRRNSTEYQSI